MTMTPEQVLQQLEEMMLGNPEVSARYRRMLDLQESAETVADIFAAYRFGVIPPEAGATQLSETEQAVYAACHTILAVFLRKVDESGEDGIGPEDWLEARLTECQNYAVKQSAARLLGAGVVPL